MQCVMLSCNKLKVPMLQFDGVNYCTTITLRSILKKTKDGLDTLLRDLDIKTVTAGQFMDKHKDLAELNFITPSTPLVEESDMLEALTTSREVLDLAIPQEDQRRIEKKMLEKLGAVPTITEDGQTGYTTQEVARVLGVTEEEVEEIAVREGMIPKVPKGRN